MADLRIRAFDSQSSDYERAFATFLAHTDQKDKAREWLDRQVARLPSRQVFVDAGAGNGKVTAWYADSFEQTVAIEPNPHLRRELAQRCPRATIVPATILEAPVGEPADFVLSSHVFYYIPAEAWLANLERMASLLAPKGVLVVVLQNAGSDCMRLVERFHGRRFSLRELADEFRAQHGQRFALGLETVESFVTTATLTTACAVAEFMLNLLPLPEPPLASDVEAFVRKEFAASSVYRFSCTQDFLAIRPRMT